MVRVGRVVDAVARDEDAARIVCVAEHRRIDVAERPDVLLPGKAAGGRDAAVVGARAGLDDLLAGIVIMLGRAARDPNRPPARAVVLIRDGRRAVRWPKSAGSRRHRCRSSRPCRIARLGRQRHVARRVVSGIGPIVARAGRDAVAWRVHVVLIHVDFIGPIGCSC